MWKDDFEYTETLASRGYTLISSVDPAPVATEGINASRGVMMNDGSGLGQFGTPNLVFPLLCGDTSRFGFGGYWKFPTALPGPAGFYFAEIRVNAFTILSFYRDEDALRVFEGVSSVELMPAIFGLFIDETRFYKIDISGNLNRTWDLSGASDGNLSIAVDNRVVVCLRNVPDMGGNFALFKSGWNNIAIGVHDAFDCLYVNNGWLCGQGPVPPGTKCVDTDDTCTTPAAGRGGPGGSFTGFDPLTPGLHTTDRKHRRAGGRPEDEVTIPPGGADPSFAACTGNGVGPTGTDPTDPQTMAAATSPMVYVEITLPDATVLTFAHENTATPAQAFRNGKIISIGSVAQHLSDHSGRMESTVVRLVLEDTDRSIVRSSAVLVTDDVHHPYRLGPGLLASG